MRPPQHGQILILKPSPAAIFMIGPAALDAQVARASTKPSGNCHYRTSWSLSGRSVLCHADLCKSALFCGRLSVWICLLTAYYGYSMRVNRGGGADPWRTGRLRAGLPRFWPTALIGFGAGRALCTAWSATGCLCRRPPDFIIGQSRKRSTHAPEPSATGETRVHSIRLKRFDGESIAASRSRR